MAAPVSLVRVFAKSVHLTAWGWLVSVWWLWLAAMRQSLRRAGELPAGYGMSILLGGLAMGVIIWLAAKWLVRLTGSASETDLERREWVRAFWWALFPNLMLLGAVWLMVAASA